MVEGGGKKRVMVVGKGREGGSGRIRVERVVVVGGKNRMVVIGGGWF